MTHSIDIRVYYEDTDAGGIVYHSNYLNFMERARTEWLRALGFESQKLMTERRLCFVVARIEIAYKRPAFLDDSLSVSCGVESAGPMRFNLRQTVRRGEEIVTDATVELAMIDLNTNRATKIPDDLREKILN